jgi:hypothetical protein
MVRFGGKAMTREETLLDELRRAADVLKGIGDTMAYRGDRLADDVRLAEERIRKFLAGTTR